MEDLKQSQSDGGGGGGGTERQLKIKSVVFKVCLSIAMTCIFGLT